MRLVPCVMAMRLWSAWSSEVLAHNYRLCQFIGDVNLLVGQKCEHCMVNELETCVPKWRSKPVTRIMTHLSTESSIPNCNHPLNLKIGHKRLVTRVFTDYRHSPFLVPSKLSELTNTTKTKGRREGTQRGVVYNISMHGFRFGWANLPTSKQLTSKRRLILQNAKQLSHFNIWHDMN